MSNKQITLSEYSYIFTGSEDEGKNKAVDADTFNELESFVLKNSDVVQYFKIGQNRYHKFIQAQNYVGVIQTKSGTTIEILPKITNLKDEFNKNNKIIKTKEDKTKEILIRMLKTLKNSPFKNFNMANLTNTKLPLLDIFIIMFLDELSNLVKKGIKSDYIIKEDNLKYLKGKLLINKQIRYNYIHKERFFVEYQDYLSNRVENRLIKTTLKFLYKKSNSNQVKQRIREFLFVFDEIGISKDIKSDFKKVKLNRQMKYYEQTLLWCKTFLFGNSFSPYRGKDVAFALLFDMNKLFESYVGAYLKHREHNVSLQDRGKYLVENPKKFALRPDIVVKEGNEIIIADTKWKLLSEDKIHNGVSQGDMYQLYAYGTKYEGCKTMYLIYPYDGIQNGDFYEYFQKNNINDLKEALSLKILFFDVTEEFKNYNFRLTRQT